MKINLPSIYASVISVLFLFVADMTSAQSVESAQALVTTAAYDSIYHYYTEDNTPLKLVNRDIDMMYDDTLLLSYVNQSLEGTSWTNEYKRTFTYDDNGRPLTHAYSPWNGSAFGDYSLIKWTYDNNRNNTIYLHEMMTDTGWSVLERHDRVFGNSNELLEEITFFSGETMKSVYSYMSGLLKDTLFVSTLTDSTWVNDYIIVYEYDDNENIVKEAVSRWNDNSWEPSVLTTRQYDASNNLISEITGYYFQSGFIYDSSDSLWYDTGNRLTGQLRKIWNVDIAAWENFQIIDYTYSTEGNLISRQSRLWNTSDWMLNYINTLTYRADIVESQKWIEYGYYSPEIDYIDSTWYYFDITTDISKLPNTIESVQAFPNPTTDMVTLTTSSEIQSLRVYAPGGKLVQINHLRQSNGKQAQLDLSTNQPGIYIVDIQTNIGRVMVKVIKK